MGSGKDSTSLSTEVVMEWCGGGRTGICCRADQGVVVKKVVQN